MVYNLFPEDKFHALINTTAKEKSTDEEIYKTVQKNLKNIKPFLSELTMALPALKKQKKEMAQQVLQLIDVNKNFDGYLEIGSTGRYISELRKHITLQGEVFITNDIAPNNSIADIFERGQLTKIGTFFPLTYTPISEDEIASESISLITCHIGLHHCPHNQLEAYIKSMHRVLRKGGIFIMRDHDVSTPEMATFVSLVHTVFNLGLGISWEIDSTEFKSFKSVEEWSALISTFGFKDSGKRIMQDNDPSDNTLVSFTKL